MIKGTLLVVSFRFIHEPVDPMAPPMAKKERAKHPYKTIGCVFNHRAFYANNQVAFFVYQISHLFFPFWLGVNERTQTFLNVVKC